MLSLFFVRVLSLFVLCPVCLGPSFFFSIKGTRRKRAGRLCFRLLLLSLSLLMTLMRANNWALANVESINNNQESDFLSPKQQFSDYELRKEINLNSSRKSGIRHKTSQTFNKLTRHKKFLFVHSFIVWREDAVRLSHHSQCWLPPFILDSWMNESSSWG